MSVCKQGGECRQGSGGGDEGTSGSPEGEVAGKKSAQIKKHKGNGSGATEEAAEGEKGCRPHANRLGKQCTALR